MKSDDIVVILGWAKRTGIAILCTGLAFITKIRENTMPYNISEAKREWYREISTRSKVR